ncbi:hypothetical protein [Sulfurimonas sp.]|uniref:hypothetical protein n=1 Tax=Sulfurimonas sp. TaxID=2022749 RepID=UPI0019DCFF8F|nr:hypothetical protein [Sulfurimonas sp.]MBE0514880.1 hypothetical protein [Sulfurimonas sp.]
MKNIIMTILAVTLFSACSKVDGVNPSQNQALNSVSGKTEKKKSGYMQQKLDKWLNKEWSPVVEGIKGENGTSKLVEVKTGTLLKEMTKEEVIKQKEVQEKYSNEDRNFTLQEYVEKMALYNSTHASDEDESHAQKINSMPAIGNKK